MEAFMERTLLPSMYMSYESRYGNRIHYIACWDMEMDHGVDRNMRHMSLGNLLAALHSRFTMFPTQSLKYAR